MWTNISMRMFCVRKRSDGHFQGVEWKCRGILLVWSVCRVGFLFCLCCCRAVNKVGLTELKVMRGDAFVLAMQLR